MLNENQKLAVEHYLGPCLTIAPPGSGKTKCLVERVVHLITVHHIKPDKILVVTFTKDAACEMKERFCKEFTSDGGMPFFGTFHSLFFHILKVEGYYSSKDIIQSSVAYAFMKQALLECKISKKDVLPFTVIKEISRCINLNMSYSDYISNTLEDQFEKVATFYKSLMEQKHLIDFDDMMIKVYELFLKDNDLRLKWQKKFDFILLDEMQDINELQFEIIKLLLQEEQNIFAVGDDDQSIYEFRGSKPDIMLNFQKSFKNTAIVKLNINYRSLRQIITAANCLINKNVHRFQKDCRCFLNQYGSIHYLQFENEAKQA
ncbi:MAG: ATP-dependent helicase, partial [Lachnospiraceae bacterium]|nr:ATP-dependent helicase [Lachnospiraceae bacterium]